MKGWKLIFFFLLLSIPLLSFSGEKILFKDSFEKEGVWKGGGKRISEFAHTGKYCWKLSSPSPVVYKGKKVDWVKQQINSIPFSVKEGMVLSVSVWINISQKLEHTSRGGVLNLWAHYKSTDKWEQVYLKEGSIFTGGWKKISAIYTVPKGVDKLKVRLGICGKGVVYFDDVEVKEVEVSAFQKKIEVRKGEGVEIPVETKGWKTGGLEGSVERKDGEVIWHIKFNYTSGSNPKYPLGWPSLAKEFAFPLNLEEYGYLKFSLKVDADRPLPSPFLKVGLRVEGEKTQWKVVKGKRDRWEEISIPLSSLSRKRVKALVFYIAERWYKNAGFPDGDLVSFHFKNIRFLKTPGQVIQSAYLAQYDYPQGSKLTIFLPQTGEGKINIKIKRKGKVVKEGTYPVKKIIKVGLGNLSPGIYELLLSQGKRNLSLPFRIVKEPFPYLLCVSFYTKWFAVKNLLDEKWVEAVNKTPYHGVAVEIFNAYAVSPPPEFEEVKPLVNLLKEKCRKDIWPWVFFNRFIGREKRTRYVAATKTYQTLPEKQWNYFGKIKGIDIYDEAGALSDFYKIYRLALRISRTLHSPGIVIDNEAYNNHSVYDVGYLSQKLKKSREEIIQQLKKIGYHLADIAEEEYPHAVLWFLFLRPGGSTTYIGEGIMERAEEKGIPLKVVEGGEVSLGYINPSLDALHLRMKERGYLYREWMRKYPRVFYLGATISPTDTPETRVKGKWIYKGYANTSIKSIEDLKPHLRDIFSTYKYVWIYAASAARFNPFTSQGVGGRINNAIGEVLEEVRGFPHEVKFEVRKEKEEVPEAYLPLYSGKPPVIDGRLDDECWGKALKMENFKDYRTGKLARYKTVGFILRDRENLYIGFKCHEPKMEEAIKSVRYRKDEEPVWRDECVEIFIDPTLSREKFYHWIVNLSGYKTDMEGGVTRKGMSYTSDFKAETFKGKDFWSVEVEIPLKSLGDYGEVWGFNLCRERHLEEGEYSCWSPTYGGFENPLRFGKIYLK